MKSISDLVVSRNRAAIANIVTAYISFNIPAFITIETDTYDRNIVSPKLGSVISDYSSSEGYSIKHIKDFEMCFDSFNPITMISRLVEKNAFYLKEFSALIPGQALICIDYESDGTRSLFDPLVWSD